MKTGESLSIRATVTVDGSSDLSRFDLNKALFIFRIVNGLQVVMSKAVLNLAEENVVDDGKWNTLGEAGNILSFTVPPEDSQKLLTLASQKEALFLEVFLRGDSIDPEPDLVVISESVIKLIDDVTSKEEILIRSASEGLV